MLQLRLGSGRRRRCRRLTRSFGRRRLGTPGLATLLFRTDLCDDLVKYLTLISRQHRPVTLAPTFRLPLCLQLQLRHQTIVVFQPEIPQLHIAL